MGHPTVVATPPPVFVVGTGRCGSTLVSEMLHAHPDLGSVSEFFSLVTDLGSQVARAFPEGDVDASTVWRLIGQNMAKQNVMLAHDVAMDEVLYPFGTPGHRFNRTTGVPPIAQTALPHAFPEDFDRAYSELEAFVGDLAPAPIGTQYGRVFEWMARRGGAQQWVERSGGSLRVAHRLLEHWPQARLVHVVRDGRNTALSMSRHTGFRMALVALQMTEGLGADPFESGDRTWESDLPDDVAALLPERFTRQAFMEFETAPALCGHYWSGEIIEGLKVLDTVPPERVMTLRYESLLAEPEAECRRLGRFIVPTSPLEVEDAWVTHCASLVGHGRSSWQQLESEARQDLEHACAPGFAALAERGVRWPDGAEGAP